MDYFDVFDSIFQRKLRECIKDEEERKLSQSTVEKEMFEFSKRRVAEIEAEVNKAFLM
jgi:DnaJ-domain-containing protein 1